MGNPDYHLRPNKAVDRNLFVESLVKLEKIIDLSNHRYIGFGSYEFDEYKLIYRSLGIEDMHSIEKDSDIYRRQGFNKPYSCITLYNDVCGTYFDEEFEEDRHSIIWVDFSDANEKLSQCQDITNICARIHENDVLRITFNANPTGIKEKKKSGSSVPNDAKMERRYEWLKDDLGTYFPEGASKDDLTTSQYPLLLLKIIKRAVYKNLDGGLFACPICSYVYSDGTQMVTVTIIFGNTANKDEMIAKLRCAYAGWEEYVKINEWDNPIKINLPPLTVHEQLEINQYGITEEDVQRIKDEMGISEEDVKRYQKFARYYPNFQPVII